MACLASRPRPCRMWLRGIEQGGRSFCEERSPAETRLLPAAMRSSMSISLPAASALRLAFRRRSVPGDDPCAVVALRRAHRLRASRRALDPPRGDSVHRLPRLGERDAEPLLAVLRAPCARRRTTEDPAARFGAHARAARKRTPRRRSRRCSSARAAIRAASGVGTNAEPHSQAAYSPVRSWRPRTSSPPSAVTAWCRGVGTGLRCRSRCCRAGRGPWT